MKIWFIILLIVLLILQYYISKNNYEKYIYLLPKIFFIISLIRLLTNTYVGYDYTTGVEWTIYTIIQFSIYNIYTSMLLSVQLLVEYISNKDKDKEIKEDNVVQN